MISALAKGGQILGNDTYLDEAKRVASFLFKNLVGNEELKRRWREGEARFDAVVEDYAFLTMGDLWASATEGEYEGNKTMKVKMKNGRTLTTLVLTDGRWLADTIWFQ